MKEFSRAIVVSADHPSLAGHFPGNPIVPGVVLLDRILAEIKNEIGATQLIAIAGAKFQQPVGPNETVTISVRIAEEQQSLRARFTAVSSRGAVAEGSFILQAASASHG